MRVVLISPLGKSVGGIATWTKVYMEYSKDKGFDVLLMDTSENRKKTLWKTIIYSYESTKNYFKAIKTGDIIHLNSPCSNFALVRDFVYVKLANKKNISIILHYHCDISHMIQNRFKEFLLRNSVKMASEVFVLNDASMKKVKNHSDKVVLFPNFLKSEKSIYIDRNIIEIKNILFVGRISKLKGYDILDYLAKMNPSITFNIVGAICENNLIVERKNIKILGVLNTDEVNHAMDSSDAFILPSRTEGFPMVILEAMSHSLPIFASNVGAIPEMIESRECCIFDIKNEYDLIDKSFKKFLLLNLKLNLIAKKNHTKFISNYTVDVVLKQIYLKYEKLIEGKNVENNR